MHAAITEPWSVSLLTLRKVPTFRTKPLLTSWESTVLQAVKVKPNV